MNETEQTRKKRPSLWWLWLLLVLAAFAGGVILGLKMTTLPLPNDLKMMLISAVVPSEAGTAEKEPASLEPPAMFVTPDPAASVADAAPEAEPTEAPLRAAVETEAPAPTPAPTEKPAYIGVNAALEAALAYSEVEKADAEVTGVFRTKDEDGLVIYEVNFRAGGVTYEYQINALTGEIEGWKVSGFTFSDTATFGAAPPAETPAPEESAAPVEPEPSEGIDEARALEIAFADAGIEASSAMNVKTRVTEKYGEQCYEIRFRTTAGSFSYDIGAATGEITGFVKP